MNINFHYTLLPQTVCRFLFPAASLGGRMVGLSPLWMEQGKLWVQRLVLNVSSLVFLQHHDNVLLHLQNYQARNALNKAMSVLRVLPSCSSVTLLFESILHASLDSEETHADCILPHSLYYTQQQCNVQAYHFSSYKTLEIS